MSVGGSGEAEGAPQMSGMSMLRMTCWSRWTPTPGNREDRGLVRVSATSPACCHTRSPVFHCDFRRNPLTFRQPTGGLLQTFFAASWLSRFFSPPASNLGTLHCTTTSGLLGCFCLLLENLAFPYRSLLKFSRDNEGPPGME